MRGIRYFSFCAAIALSIVVMGARALAAPTPTFTYEGYLEDGSGPVGPGTAVNKNFVFEIWGQDSNGSCKLATQSLTLPVKDGNFSAEIGAMTYPGGLSGLTAVFDLNNTSIAGASSCTFNAADTSSRRYLQVYVEGNSMGQVDFTRAPVAMVAQTLQGYTPSTLVRVNPTAQVTQTNVEQFYTVARSTPGNSVYYDGTNFVSYNPRDGAQLTAGSVGNAAISALDWAKLTGIPSNISQIAGLSCSTGQYLKYSGSSWGCAAISVSETDPTVAAYAKNAPGAGLIVNGSNQIVPDFGTSAGKVVQGNDSRLSDSRAPNGSASGDLSGTYPSPTVAKLQGRGVSVTAPADGQVLRYNTGASQWEPYNLGIGDLKTSIGTSQFISASCTASQTLIWSSVTNTFQCTNIAINASQVSGLSLTETDPKVGANTTNALSKWNGSALVASGVVESGGNIGIGTSSPTKALDVQGSEADVWINIQNNSSAGGSRWPGLNIQNYMGSNIANSEVWLATSRGSLASPSPVLSGDPIGGISGWGQYDTTPGNSNPGAYIYFYAGGNFSASSTPGEISLQTTPTGSMTTQERMRITQAGRVGIGTNNPSAQLDVAGTINATAMTINGVPVGTSTGMTSLNGSSQATQTFATPGVTGAAPNWLTNAGTGAHTLNIPMANTASVTAGLISKTEYDNFNNKQPAGNYITALTGDVVANGPNSAAATIQSNAVTTTKINDKAVTYAKMQDVTSNRLLGRSTAGAGNPEEIQVGGGLQLSGGTLSLSGTLGTVTNVTSANAYISVTNNTSTPLLTANVGTASNTLAAGDDARITGALQKSGGTMTGAINMGANDVTNVGNITMAANKNIQLGAYSVDPGGLTTADKGKTWFNTTSGQIKYWDGGTAVPVAASGAAITSLGGQTGTSQSFAAGTAGNSPAISSSGNVHTLNVPLANAGASVTSGTISNADYVAFNAKLGTSTSFGGDVGGTYNATVVDKIKGVVISAAPTISGQVLRYNGTQLVPNFISMADLRSQVTGTQALSTGCTAAQTMTWNSATDSLSCTAIAINGSQVSGNITGNAVNVTGTVAIANGGTGQTTANAAFNALVPSQTSSAGKFLKTDGTNTSWASESDPKVGTNTLNYVPKWNNTALVAGSIYDNGNIGIGTNSPSTTLHVSSNGSPVSPFKVSVNNPVGGMEMQSSAGTARFGVDTDNSMMRINLDPISGSTRLAVRSDGYTMISANGSVPQAPGAGSAGTVLHVTGTDGSPSRLLVDSFGGGQANLTLRAANGSAATPSQLLNGNNAAGISFKGYGSSQYSSATTGAMIFKATEDWTNSANGTSINFLTTPNGSTGQNVAMVLDQSGNVGIGSTIPSANLDIVSTGTNPGTQYAFLSSITSTSTLPSAYGYPYAGNFQVDDRVATGAYNGGNAYGLNVGSYRNTKPGDGGGTRNGQFGVVIGYGHRASTGVTPVTNYSYGVYIDQYYQSGTINNMYDIYLGAGNGNVANVGNRWGLYQSGTSALNYFGGNVGIGTDTPTNKLEVNGPVKLGSGGSTIASMGVCSFSGTITDTAAAFNCSGLPLTTAVAVNCSGNGVFQTTGTTLYCRATGSSAQLWCNTSKSNTTSMSYTCMWAR